MTSTLRSALLAAAALAAAALAAATPAWAQQPSPPPAASQGGGARGPGALFEQMDGNKDDRVTWDEAWRYVQQRFAAADSDRDGGLTRQEAEALRPTGGRRREGSGSATAPTPEQTARWTRFGDVVFRGLDANRDSRVTLDEVRPAVEARFRGLDADADNAVSRAELPQRRGGGPRPQNGAGQGNQGGQTPAAPR